MRAFTVDASRTGLRNRRLAALFALSAAFHMAVLGAFALKLPAIGVYAEPSAMDVSLVAPRFVPPTTSPSAPRPEPVESRLIVSPTVPRYVAAAQAPTGEAGDATDLFGPVFADGTWPRPILVRSEPCDPRDEDADDCRRDLMLMGVAREGAAGAKPAS